MNIDSICIMLVRALDSRVDVVKCDAKPVALRPGMIHVDICKDSGVRHQREVDSNAVSVYPNSISDLLVEWIGKEPDIKGKRTPNWMMDRVKKLSNTPAKAYEMMQSTRKTPQIATDSPQAPGSRLSWPDGKQDIADIPQIPDPQHVTHTYKDPDTNEIKPIMTRSRMIELGMDKTQREKQYIKQRGQHPDDIK